MAEQQARNGACCFMALYYFLKDLFKPACKAAGTAAQLLGKLCSTDLQRTYALIPNKAGLRGNNF